MAERKDHRGSDWNFGVRRIPSAMEVARLASSHGFEACAERWGYVNPRTLYGLIRAGKKQLERRAQG